MACKEQLFIKFLEKRAMQAHYLSHRVTSPVTSSKDHRKEGASYLIAGI
jgi:hypothetical protein